MGCGTSSSATGASQKKQQHYTPPPDIGELSIVMIRKESSATPLGIVVCVECEDEFTSIVNLKDSGVIPEYNAQHPTQQLRKGDRIISVNGFGGMGQDGYDKILSELRKVGRMHIAVKRGVDTASIVEETLDQSETNWVDKLPHAVGTDCKARQCSACEEHIDADCEVLRLSCGHVIHLQCAREQMQPCRRLVEAICIGCDKSKDQDMARLAKKKGLNSAFKRTCSLLPMSSEDIADHEAVAIDLEETPANRCVDGLRWEVAGALLDKDIAEPERVSSDPDGEISVNKTSDEPIGEAVDAVLNKETVASLLLKESTKNSTKSVGKAMREMTYTCPALKKGLPDGGLHDLNTSDCKMEFILRRAF